MEEFAFIKSVTEIGGGQRGACLGPEALEVAGWNANSSLFDDYPLITLDDHNDRLYEPIDHQYAKRIAGIIKANRQISQKTRKILDQGRFPIILTGDHSTGVGPVSAFRQHEPNEELGVIWIDAHADLHSPFTTPSGNVHGMPIGALLGIDNTDHQQNELPENTQQRWEQFKNLDGITPKLKAENLIFYGVRETETPESTYMEEHNITNFTIDTIQSEGAASITQKTFDQLSHCSKIYISFDVDSMDPSVSSGTGTPANHGLNDQEAKELLIQLAKEPKVAGLEITEINPTLDTENQMAKTTFQILEAFIQQRKQL